jgi:hypothetical protein
MSGGVMIDIITMAKIRTVEMSMHTVRVQSKMDG